MKSHALQVGEGYLPRRAAAFREKLYVYKENIVIKRRHSRQAKKDVGFKIGRDYGEDYVTALNVFLELLFFALCVVCKNMGGCLINSSKLVST